MKWTLAILLFLFTLQVKSFGNFAFWKLSSDPCNGTPALGTTCTGGAIYAGQFDGGKYMITPSGCTDSSNPICAGSGDTLQKLWRGTSGGQTDIPGVETINTDSVKSSSSFRGDVNSAAASAHSSVSSDSAHDFCLNMSFGGYTDWYLGSKSEMAYLYCHSNSNAHNTAFPQEEPNCTSYGGKTSELSFSNLKYLTSTEYSNSRNWVIHFSTGDQFELFKNDQERVRCIRRY